MVGWRYFRDSGLRLHERGAIEWIDLDEYINTGVSAMVVSGCPMILLINWLQVSCSFGREVRTWACREAPPMPSSPCLRVKGRVLPTSLLTLPIVNGETKRLGGSAAIGRHRENLKTRRVRMSRKSGKERLTESTPF